MIAAVGIFLARLLLASSRDDAAIKSTLGWRHCENVESRDMRVADDIA